MLHTISTFYLTTPRCGVGLRVCESCNQMTNSHRFRSIPIHSLNKSQHLQNKKTTCPALHWHWHDIESSYKHLIYFKKTETLTIDSKMWKSCERPRILKQDENVPSYCKETDDIVACWILGIFKEHSRPFLPVQTGICYTFQMAQWNMASF